MQRGSDRDCGSSFSSFENVPLLELIAEHQTIHRALRSTTPNYFAKYAAVGDLVWAQNMRDQLTLAGMPGDLAVDAAGNVYVTGTFADRPTGSSYRRRRHGWIEIQRFGREGDRSA
jgi:hypothetical protein